MKRTLVRCVENAVGDDIVEDITTSNLRRHNSVRFRKWDYLYSNVMVAANAECFEAPIANRGFWELCFAFDYDSGFIIAFMQENRFAKLQKTQKSRRRMHYIDALAKYFNYDLRNDYGQLSLFPNIPHVFTNENTLSEQIHKLLSDLEGGCDIVSRHVIVLFDTYGYRLTSIRAVMVTPDLNIADGYEQNWSSYISDMESVIIPKVAEPNAPYNQPNHGLSFTSKSIARMEGKVKLKDSQEEDKKAE